MLCPAYYYAAAISSYAAERSTLHTVKILNYCMKAFKLPVLPHNSALCVVFKLRQYLSGLSRCFGLWCWRAPGSVCCWAWSLLPRKVVPAHDVHAKAHLERQLEPFIPQIPV